MSQRTLVTHIGMLHQVEKPTGPSKARSGPDMAFVPHIRGAWLRVENGAFVDYGSMDGVPELGAGFREVNAEGGDVLPCWCDSHTHLVYAGSREDEFMDRVRGQTYSQIAARGGGILRSADLMAMADEQELVSDGMQRLEEIRRGGTGAVEIKSGYGLSLEGELKILRVIRTLKEQSPLTIKATFLGAHAFPRSYLDDKEGYTRLIIEQMLPRVAEEGLADFMDVFCEEGFFSIDQAKRLMEAGWNYGLRPKVHAGQLSAYGAVSAAAGCRALSVDHVEHLGKEDLEALLQSGTIATLLPTAALFLGVNYGDTPRRLIESGIPVALASDFNPGSSPGGNMSLVLSLAAIQLKMTAEEVINAATLNGAAAMAVEDSLGSICPGKRANFMITSKMPSLAFLPYSLGRNLIKRVFIAGSEV